MKQTIRLTESELRQIVTEAVMGQMATDASNEKEGVSRMESQPTLPEMIITNSDSARTCDVVKQLCNRSELICYIDKSDDGYEIEIFAKGCWVRFDDSEAIRNKKVLLAKQKFQPIIDTVRKLNPDNNKIQFKIDMEFDKHRGISKSDAPSPRLTIHIPIHKFDITNQKANTSLDEAVARAIRKLLN